MRNFSPILTIVAALLLPVAATAQDATDQRPNRAERRQRMIEQFDADGDGQLNEEERAEAREARGNRSGKADRKGRGGGGRPQGRSDPMQVFDRFDENNDGQLSREEFMKLTAEMRERRGAGTQSDRRRAGRDGRRGPPDDRGDRGRFRSLQNPGPPLRRDDQRQDDERGFRGRDDWRGDRRGTHDRRGRAGRGFERMGPPNPERLFNAFDANGDDQLSREEFMQLTEAMRERMGRGGRQSFRRGPPEGGRPDRPWRPPPEFESMEPTEPAADDNSA